jgi:hypothetical protein
MMSSNNRDLRTLHRRSPWPTPVLIPREGLYRTVTAGEQDTIPRLHQKQLMDLASQ